MEGREAAVSRLTDRGHRWSRAHLWVQSRTRASHEGAGLGKCGVGSFQALIRDIDLRLERVQRLIVEHFPPGAAGIAVTWLGGLPIGVLLERRRRFGGRR